MTEAWLVGDWCAPVNTAAQQKGGIHDDDTASKLGFRGGTVAGSIHMEQYPPLLEEAFGPAWWKSGTLSLYFKSATIDREPVKCFVSKVATRGPIKTASVWMEKEDGTVINAGTASCGGHDDDSALRQRLTTIRQVTELRILADIKVGDSCQGVPSRVSDASVDQQLAVITQPLDYYVSPAAFGRRVLPMTRIVGAFNAAEQVLAQPAKQPFVGLYGAIEIEFVGGPVFSETGYMGGGSVCGLSDSPQTEILWRDMQLEENGTVIARMLKMDRLMKNSSPLWD